MKNVIRVFVLALVAVAFIYPKHSRAQTVADSFPEITADMERKSQTPVISDAEIRKLAIKYAPARLKFDRQGKPTASDYVGYDEIFFKLKNEKLQALAMLYFGNNEACELRIFKKIGTRWEAQKETVVQVPDQIEHCFDIDTKDLDQDGQDELIIKVAEGRETNPPLIFHWDGERMVDVTPMERNSLGYLVVKLRTVQITDIPVKKKLLIVDFNENDLMEPRLIYELQNGKIVPQGSYSFISFLAPQKNLKNEFRILKHTLESEGEYTLRIRNLSDHKRAVRADVIINGSTVFKSKDFCESPQPSRAHKDKWSGNDDDDDNDEDKCKRCTPKAEVYTTVHLKKENELKVKVYGKKDSKN
jgi:hypothetical protein